MGLAVQVGMLVDLLNIDPAGAEWLREEFEVANRVLRAHNLPRHFEPESLPPLKNRCSLIGYPYSCLHHLRRVYAHRMLDSSWIAAPLPRHIKAAEDKCLLKAYSHLQSHLLNHSDADGMYLPIDFKDVLIDRQDGLNGRMLGSSYRLYEELVFVAPALNIRIHEGRLSDDQAQEIDKLRDLGEGLATEKTVWLSLFEAARLSIEYKTAIVFT